jgi:hypothetical protein
MIQSSISAALIRPLIETAGKHGLSNENPEALDTRLIKILKDPDARISLNDADALVNKLIRNSNQSGLCVLSSQKAISHSSCQLQHLFLCSNTLREALYYLDHFSNLLCYGL